MTPTLAVRGTPLPLAGGRGLAAGRAQHPGLPADLAAHRLRLLRAAVLPALPRRRDRRAGRHRRRSGRPADRLHGVRRAGAARRLAMNGAIYDSTINVFFKLKLRQDYDAMLATPLGPGDIALGEITWALLRGTLYSVGVPRGHGGARADHVVVGGARAAGRHADRAGVRGRRHGLHVVHAQLAGLRVRATRHPADVPVLDDVLPAVGLPAGDPGRGAVHPALPRHRAGARR